MPMAAFLIAASSWPHSIATGTSSAGSSAASTRPPQARTMKIRIDINGTSVTATIDDTTAAKEFISLLPLTLTLEDYNRTEKISDLPKKLSTQGAPEGVEPSRGDVAYYAPWGNLAIFYKDFPYSRGLVKLGGIDSGIEIFEQARALKVTLRRVDD
jgi:hypothetical protein